MKNTRHALITAVCLSATLVACGGRDTAYDDTTGMRVDTAAGMTDLTREYTEAELLGLIGLANEGTIELARMAQTSATNAEVKTLAGQALQSHGDLDMKARDLAAQLNLTPMVPTADESLAEKQRQWVAELNTKPKGSEWDADYLKYEIDRHEIILDEVKDALSREQRPEMRAYLEEARKHIEGHLPAYRDVHKKVTAY